MFKTSTTFGYQAVILSDTAKEMFEIYLSNYLLFIYLFIYLTTI